MTDNSAAIVIHHVVESLTDEQLATEVARTEPGLVPGGELPRSRNVSASSSTRKGSTGSMPNVI